MVPFLVTGALLGLFIGSLAAYFGPDAANASSGQEFMAVAVPGALLGGLLGGVIYLLVERFTGHS